MVAAATESSERIAIPWRTVLLGEDLPGMDMADLRRRQAERVRARAPMQVCAILAAALAIAAQDFATHPWWLVAGWLALVAILVGARFALRERRCEGWIHHAPGFIGREITLGLSLGVVLAAPMIGHALLGHRGAADSTWTVLAGLMALHAYSTLAVPLVFCALMPIVGAGSAAALLWLGNPAGAAGALCLTAVATWALMANGRTAIRYELADRKAAERGETVSLLLREFEDTSADWLWQIDVQRRIRNPSPRFAHATGLDVEVLNGLGFVQLLSGKHWESGKFPPALHELANRLNRKEAFANLLVPVDMDGRQRWWELSASPTFGPGGVFIGFRGVGSDVTEQRASADRIAHLARFDGLTGLPNRLLVNETLAKALEQATAWRRRCVFMMIDLDRFKAVNDTLGHPVGDRLLAQVAARMKSLCNESVVAGRLGGDEFAMVLRDVDSLSAVEELGRRIIDLISRPYDIDHHTLYVGASIGYAVGPRDGASVEALIRNADLALYRSKDRGGGLINGYEPTLHDQARERREIEIALRSALTRDEFTLHYQPVVHGDGGIDGFEALLRWTNPRLGPVSPVKFIPVAEDTRLIGQIGEWVLHTACREAAGWPAATKLAVNVSAEQLSAPGFIGQVVQALSHSGIAPGRLELEVTESVFLREISGAMSTLEQLRGLGVRLVLDDFGTGYSSLGYLRMGQFSTIKVDRSFVKGALARNRESVAIIRAVVALADSLDMATTAEGIETKDEADALTSLGCTKLQGYYFGRPMPANEARALFSRIAPGSGIIAA